MSSMHTLNHTVDRETADQARYMAHMQRRTMPPRCNPISIIVLVLALGMVFIGLTMTVIAHWPGNSSIGENPLKIAGPVLLAFGLFVFIVGLVLVCFWQSQEREQWQKTMQQVAMGRSAYPNNTYYSDRRQQSQMMYSGASVHSQPQRSILKTPSISTYGKGSEYGESESGVNYNQQPGWQNTSGRISYGESDMNTSMGHEVYKIETIQDPLVGKSGPIDQSSIDYGQNVPVPIRQTKPRKPKSSTGEQNRSYSSPNDEAANPNERNMRSYSTEGYDMYADQGQGGPVPAERKKKHRKRTEDGTEGENKSSRRHGNKEKTHTNGGYEAEKVSPKQPGYYSNVPPTSSYYSDRSSYDASQAKVYGGEGLTSPMSGAGGLGLAGAGGMGLAGSGGMGLSGMGGMGVSPVSEQQLKINIRAQPSTAVHITPSMYHTPPSSRQPYSREMAASKSSVETEI